MNEILEFIGQHIDNDGTTISPNQVLLEVTEYCANYNENNRLYYFTNIENLSYFYSDLLGLIEFENINDRLFIPDFLNISVDEMNQILSILYKRSLIAQFLYHNPPTEIFKEQITDGENKLNYINDEYLYNIEDDTYTYKRCSFFSTILQNKERVYYEIEEFSSYLDNYKIIKQIIK